MIQVPTAHRERARARLLYACPTDGFDEFTRRLIACASRLDQLELCRFRDPAALAAHQGFATFVSTTQPTIVVERDGKRCR